MATADLYVTKSASPNPVGVGQPLTYTIKVKNFGPDDAINVGMTDTVPDGVCICSLEATDGTFCFADGEITWNLDLDKDQEETMTVIVVPQSAGTIGNTAIVFHNTDDENDPDPDPHPNSASVTVVVTPVADLLIIKDSCPKNTFVGETVDFLLTVINNGPSNATGVEVTDNVPVEITIQNVELSQGTFDQSGNTITAHLGTLDANDKATIRITGLASMEGSYLNEATVQANEPDPNLENNSDDAEVIVAKSADIEVTKIASTDHVELGETFTYTLFVTNNGPSTADNVSVVDTLPDNLEVLQISMSQGTASGVYPIITFLIGTLGPGGTATITIQVRATEEGMFINNASGSSPLHDPDPCNNSASVCTFVTRNPSTDVSVVKAHSPEPAGLCSPVLYTITVTNNGPINATGITLVDQLPPSLEIMSVKSSQGRCNICSDNMCPSSCSCGHNDMHKDGLGHEDMHHVGCREHEGCYNPSDPCNSKCFVVDPCHQRHCHEDPCRKLGCHESICSRSSEIVCQLGALAVHASAIVQVCARPRMLGTITNTVIVTANEIDPDQTNNQYTDTLTVVPLCDVVEQLIDMVNEMINNGDIDPINGEILLTMLKNAKIYLCCSSTAGSICCTNNQGAECALEGFVDKVRMYIVKELISEEQGCSLIMTAELILDALKCCKSCHKSGCYKV